MTPNSGAAPESDLDGSSTRSIGRWYDGTLDFRFFFRVSGGGVGGLIFFGWDGFLSDGMLNFRFELPFFFPRESSSLESDELLLIAANPAREVEDAKLREGARLPATLPFRCETAVCAMLLMDARC
jgi:hypothetical protein